MRWQERQNAGLAERCISFSTPATREKSGRKKNTPNARIFPARLTVIAGRTTTTPASTALNSTRTTMAMVGIDLKSDSSLLLQRADVSDQVLNLFRLQALAVSRHLAFAAADNSCERVVALRLHIRGTQIPNVVRFAHRGLALPVRPMASRA